MKELSFCSFCCGSAAILLLPDLIQNKSKAGDRSQESTEHLGNKSILAGQFAETVKLVCGQNAAFNNAALDGQGELVLLGVLAYDTSGSDGIACGAG